MNEDKPFYSVGDTVEEKLEFLWEHIANLNSHLSDYRDRCEAIARERDEARAEVARLKRLHGG